MGSRMDTESLYGSSIYRGGHFADETDLPEYAQLCRKLFPTLVSAEDDDAVEPEEEENIARYFKYLTGLPLASLKMEPTLLQSDLQRISSELTTLLLNETAKAASQKGSRVKSSTHPLSQEGCAAGDVSGQQDDAAADQSEHIFKIVYETHKLASSTAGEISSDLDKTKGILSRLEQACGVFTDSMADLDKQAKVVQCVLDKQDLISRIVELPRVMQMCVAGGYYEEAVEIAEHVRVTGDRLIQDVSEDAQTLPGSKVESHTTAASRDQLIQFVGTVQRQVRVEFESMVLGLCRELGYSRTTTQLPAQKRASEPRNGSVDGYSYDRSMKRLSHVAKIVAILRSIGVFSESELQMLYLRSRWQAWLQMAEALNGFAPAISNPLSPEPLPTDQTIKRTTPSGATAANSLSTAPLARRGSDKSTNSAEVSAFLTRYIDAFCSWLAEVDMQYRTFFSAKTGPAKDTSNAASTNKSFDQFIDLAIYSSQQFLAAVLPLLSSVTDASGISSLETLVATHARALSRSNLDMITPFLMQTLYERAFICVVGGIEDAIAGICAATNELASSTSAAGTDKPSGSSHQRWEQLAVSTRPPLELAQAYNPELCSDPPRFFGQYRVSPVGLLQYPLLAKLLNSFRDSLHALRIFVLAGDAAGSKAAGQSETLVLLRMVCVVFESELIRAAEAMAAMCSGVLGNSESDERVVRAARDACAAFVFGLARSVSETFEEICTLNETAIPAGDADSTLTLYSQAVYSPLLPFL
ncbi:hypothetical protein GGI12_000253 [Dipsacomyces acuminosporus]|nr:hypothetical protein GGI12_000253 [Dipsacomyces acuminosporus]